MVKTFRVDSGDWGRSWEPLDSSTVHVWLVNVSKEPANLLPSLLELYLGKAFELRVGENGKPEVEGLQFNISHSGDYMALAFSLGRSVGVDIEVERRSLVQDRIASEYFSLSEVKRFGQLSAEDRTREFIRLWSATEATIKCFGGSLFRHIQDVEVSLAKAPRVVRLPDEAGQPGECRLQEIEAPDGYRCFLAVK